MDERQDLINWLSGEIAEARGQLSSLQPQPPHPFSQAEKDSVSKLNDTIEKRVDPRSRVPGSSYVLDEARTMRIDDEDHRRG